MGPVAAPVIRAPAGKVWSSRFRPESTVSARLPAAERRRQLLDSALPTFAQLGFRGTSMNQIAEAAGVTKPVLYQHFASKRELFSELLADVGGQLETAIVEATATAATPRDQVERGFRAYFEYVATRRDAFLLLFGAGTRLDPEFAQIVRRFEAGMAHIIANLIAVDGLDEPQRNLLAHGIVGIAEVTSRHWLHAAGATLDPSPEVLASQISVLAWAGLRGIEAA